MSCESGNSQEDMYDFVITQYLDQYKALFGKNDLMINSLMAISGILDEDPVLSQKIADTLGYEAIQEDNLLARLINILKRNASMEDLQAVMPLISDKITQFDINNMTYLHCQDLFKALEGDLVSTASIGDMLQNTDSHFRSLIASLLTGKTKFDYLKTEDESAISMKDHHEVDESDSEGEEEKVERKPP
jgi:hypothetical protein